MCTMITLATRLQAIEQRIAAAAAAAGRQADEITLVAVSKTWPVETLVEAYRAGVRHFGENRPEELAAKAPALQAALGPDHGAVWHFIGNVQSRKVAPVAAYADQFHALDRLKIARRMDQFLLEAGRTLPVLLEVNISGESSKAGFQVDHWEEDSDQQLALRQAVEEIAALPRLQIQGLMTIAPWEAPAAEIAAIFSRTRMLSAWLRSCFPDLDWSRLSMGMTDDFELAIAAGATDVRIGRAIFGERSS